MPKFADYPPASGLDGAAVVVASHNGQTVRLTLAELLQAVQAISSSPASAEETAITRAVGITQAAHAALVAAGTAHPTTLYVFKD